MRGDVAQQVLPRLARWLCRLTSSGHLRAMYAVAALLVVATNVRTVLAPSTPPTVQQQHRQQQQQPERQDLHGVRWLTFYNLNTTEQHGIINLATDIGRGGSPFGTQLLPGGPLLNAWTRYGIPGMLDLEDVGGDSAHGLYFINGLNNSHVNPNWRALVDELLESAMPWLQAGALKAVFIGDEPCCSGVPLSEVAAVADHVKARINHTDALVVLNECQRTFDATKAPPNFPGLITGVPTSVDVISADLYWWWEPALAANLTRQFYQTLIYPRMAPHQSAWLVPGLFGEQANAPTAAHDQLLVEKLDDFWEWARSDPRVTGLHPWHWISFPTLGQHQRGAGEYPLLIQRLREIGQLIANESGQPPASPVAVEPVRTLGSYDLNSEETTPIMWHGRLIHVEKVGGNLIVLPHDQRQSVGSYFRIRQQALLGVGNNDVLVPKIPGSRFLSYANALSVERAGTNGAGNDTLYVFGTNDCAVTGRTTDSGCGFLNHGLVHTPCHCTTGPLSRSQVWVLWSSDPQLRASSWQKRQLLELPPDLPVMNTDVTRGPGGSFVMALETQKGHNVSQVVKGVETFVVHHGYRPLFAPSSTPCRCIPHVSSHPDTLESVGPFSSSLLN